MTPKEKASSIVESYQNIKMLKDFGGMDLEIAKECAKIHVRGIIKMLSIDFTSLQKEKLLFWNDVLKEIDKL